MQLKVTRVNIYNPLIHTPTHHAPTHVNIFIMSQCITRILYTTNQQSNKVISHSRTKQLKVILIASLSFQFLSSIVYMSLAHPQKQCIPVHCQNNKTVHPARFGKYDELLQAGYDFVELVAPYDSSMELVESTTPMGDRELPLSWKPSNETAMVKNLLFFIQEISHVFQRNLYKYTINISFSLLKKSIIFLFF